METNCVRRSARFRPLMSEGCRELSFDRHGLVATGDGNRADLDEVALENMNALEPEARSEKNLRRREIAGSIASSRVAKIELALDPDEWEQIAQFDWEIQHTTEDVRDWKRKEKEDVEEHDIFTIARAERAQRRKEAIESVQNFKLVTNFGFTAEDLVSNVDGRFPMAMSTKELDQVVAACVAGNELANISNDTEVAKVVGWTGALPKSLAGFGADRLYRAATALQERIAQIKESEETERKVIRIRPRATLTSQPSNSLPPVPSQKPEGADWLGRVFTTHGPAYLCTCGCKVPVLEKEAQVPPFDVMNVRQGGRVCSKDLWRHAFAPYCIRNLGRGFSLVETRDRAFAAEAVRAEAMRKSGGAKG